MQQTPEETVRDLLALWQRERQAARERFRLERDLIPWKERIERGLAAHDLSIEETLPAPGGRLVLVVRSDDPRFDRNTLRLRPGDPVRLFIQDPNEPTALHAIVERWRGPALGIAVDGDVPEVYEDKPFRLEREAPEATFDRGQRAMERLKDAHGETAHLLKVVYGKAMLEWVGQERVRGQPLRGLRGPVRVFDQDLDEAQRDAVDHVLNTLPIALLHGPPGTGKTRCLVEVIRQLVAKGQRVLAVAASNVAVDNLVERLVAHRVNALRLGHPARVLPEVEPYTLAARLDAHEASKLTRSWVHEANMLRKKTENQAARGTGDRHARREAFAEARRLMKDARMHLRRVEQALVAQCPVVCATLAGADAGVLRDETFDVVVIDEATQAVDPLAWIALSSAPRAILAGDPHQLPPTVIDPEAARRGLGTTIFDRLYRRLGDAAVRMLTTQHRMHVDIMAYPSEALYQGRLVAHPAVAQHTLDDLAVAADPLRPGARVWLDCAGAGYADEKREPDGSTRNPEMAARTATEVLRLLSRGLAPSDCAVLTPYDAQVSELRARLAAAMEAGLEVGSIDGFQGREKEAIVLDLVRSNDAADIGFLADIRRMNVALTRARRFLLVVGDSATIGQHPFYAGFLTDVETRGAWVSVFSDDGGLF